MALIFVIIGGMGRLEMKTSIKRWFVKALILIAMGHAALILAAAFLVAHPNPLKVFKDYGAPEDYGLVAETLHTKAGRGMADWK